jgi:hypothetical protein
MAEHQLPKAGIDKMLFAMVNIPRPTTICYKITTSYMADVSESSVM